MFENVHRDDDGGVGRRGFLGGLTGLLAASAYSLEVPDEVAAQVTSGSTSNVQRVQSPDGSIEVTVDVSSGVPEYSVAFDGTTYVDPSPVGFSFADQETSGTGIGTTGPTVAVSGTQRESGTETWTPEWGNYDTVSEDYEYMAVGLEETGGPRRTGNLVVRVFDDGLGFRFVFGEEFGSFTVTSENTEFNFSEDYTAWWIRNEFVNPRFEQEYRETPLSEVDAGSRTIRPNDNTVRTGAHTPLTMRADDGTYLSVHEANLEDYATMSLAAKADGGGREMAAELAPLPDGTKVKADAPHATPWRTVQVGTRPGELIESELVPLLAPDRDDDVLPDDGGGVDTSWITPRTYVGVWWTMIAGNANWEYKSDSEAEADGQDPAAYIHGARTERTRRYMAFASEHGIDSVLVEGWNEGWDTYPGDGTGLEMGVDDSYPDFDLGAVTDYGRNRSPSVELTIHNETAGNVVNYEDEIENDGVFDGYEREGIRSIKNGYVSDPGLGFEGDGSVATHNQHCQTSVNHHRLVIREAARNRQMLEIHEGIKPTGEIRTYPNVAAREVVTAQEYDGFDELASDVGRDHHVLLPFTRMLAGPTSYQPGIFDVTFNDDSDARIETTRAKQLAMYPNYLGGLQMAADRIEAYVSPTVGVGEFVHAAAGELDGMVTADEWRNAIGAHYVPFDPNREPSGSSVTFRVTDVPVAGEYDLHLRYAADEEDNAARVGDNGGPQATLNVNGSATTITPPYTAYWDDWAVFTTTVSLEAGDNAVAVELDYDDSGGFSGDVGGFNLDAVGVSEAGAGSPVPANYGDVDPDLENYDTVREFDFVEAVPAGWDDTVVLDGEIGDLVATAKQSGEEWYVGAMTDGTGRTVDLDLDFLSSTADGWVLELYADDAGTDVETDPTSVRVTESIVSAGDTVQASMARGGGTAMRLRPATAGEASDLPDYRRPPTDLTYDIDANPDPGQRFVSATGTNDTNYVGGRTVEVFVDGSFDARENLRFAPGAIDRTVQFPTTIAESGTYLVELREARTGDTLASREVTVSDTVASFDDQAGDDAGPGMYVYPTADAFEDGAFDLLSFEVSETSSAYEFVFEVANLYDAFDSGAFSPHYFVVWLRDPSLSGGTADEVGDLDVVTAFEEPWHYRVAASGFESSVVDAAGTDLGSPAVAVDLGANTVTVSVEKTTLDDLGLADASVAPVVGSEDYGTFRNVGPDATEWEFGTAKDVSTDNAPRVIDMVVPDGVDQSDALTFDDVTLAQLPFTSI